MVQAIAALRSLGRRFTSPGDFAEVCVQALTTVGPGTEGGINRVEFYLSFNGAAPVTASSSVLEDCFPNHSDTASLIPGAAAGTLAPFPGYLIRVPMSSTPVGTITITAKVFSNAGTQTLLELPVTLFNDSDGVDRRPSAKDLWVSPLGSDSNPGTQAQPFASVQKAFQNEMGGSTVHLMQGLHVWGSPSGSFTNWRCSGGHWVNVVWEPGAVTTRLSLGTDGFVFTGTTPGTACRLKMTNSTWLNWGGVVFNDVNVLTEVWLDGGLQVSQHWSPSKRWSLRFLETHEKVMKLANTNTAAGGRMFVTNFTWLGNVAGPSEFYSMQDCVVSDFIGIAMETFGFATCCNVVVQSQRAYRDVAGRVHGPATGCNVTVPVAGQMRIDQTAGLVFAAEGDGAPMSLATLAEIVNNARFQVECSGFAQGGNNGVFTVLEAGTNGSGFGYAILANPNAVAGAVGAGATMKTYSPFANPPTDLAHPDLLWMGKQTGSFYYGLVARDLDSAQTLFAPGTPGPGNEFVRCAWWNCRDGNNKSLIMNFNGVPKTDCLFVQNTIAGVSQWAGSTLTGTQIMNNVFGQATGLVGALTVDSNHFITGATFGTNASSGAWFAAGSVQVSPWHYTPSGGNLGTASALCPNPAFLRWQGAAAITRGCFPDAGLFDWNRVPSGGRDIIAEFSATQPITLQAGFRLGIDARLAATQAITLQATFSLSGPQIATTPSQARSAFGGSSRTASATVPATPSDSLALPFVANGFVCTGGNVSVLGEDGDTVAFTNLPAGKRIDLRIRRVNATGTTATSTHVVY